MEERHLALKKELMETQSRLEENEEEQEEVIKKYKSAVQQVCLCVLVFFVCLCWWVFLCFDFFDF